MKIRGNTVGTPMKPEKNLVKATDLTEEEKAQARKNIGAGTKISIVDEIPANAKDGDMFVLRSNGEEVPAPDSGNIPGGSLPDGKFVTEDQMQQYVNAVVGGINFNETDPTVPDWAKEKEKPSYAANEIAVNMTIDENRCTTVDAALNALTNRSSEKEWVLAKEAIIKEDVQQYTIEGLNITGEILIQYEIVAASSNTKNSSLRIYFNKKAGNELYEFGNAIYSGVKIFGYLWREYYSGWFAPRFDGKRYCDINAACISKANFVEIIESVTLYCADTAAILGKDTVCKIYARG